MKRLFAFFIIATFSGHLLAQSNQPIFVESLPERFQARLEVKTRAASSAAAANHANVAPRYFIFFTKRWPNASTASVKVAFLGGDDSLRAQIASAASEWSNYGNVKFDFKDPNTGRYREWTRGDHQFSADIRVAFDGVDGGGYWSIIGKDSSDPTLIAPNEASLELQGFESSLPPDWQAVVRHEFGHAIGLQHEHQMPVGGCDQDFKWEDDPGYVPTQDIYGQYVNDSSGRKPGIYTMLAGAPNFWSKSKVDFNMRQLAIDSQNYDFGDFDRLSIMKYYFDARLFRDGKNSHCYSDENLVISQLDKQGIAKWYPVTNSAALKTIIQQQGMLLNAIGSTVKMQSVESIQPLK